MEETPILDLLIATVFRFEGLYYMHRFNRSDVKILIPMPLAYLLRHEYMMNNVISNIDSTGLRFNVMGYEVELGYEMAVVIFHKDCTRFIRNPPVIKIPLMPGFAIADNADLIQRVLFKISKIETTNHKYYLN